MANKNILEEKWSTFLKIYKIIEEISPQPIKPKSFQEERKNSLLLPFTPQKKKYFLAASQTVKEGVLDGLVVRFCILTSFCSFPMQLCP